MAATVNGYTIGIGISEEGPVYQIHMGPGMAGGEATVWAVHDVLVAAWQAAYPSIPLASEVVRNESERVTLTRE